MAHIIVMMSLTDFIASIFVALGYRVNPVLCALQGAATVFFFIASWLWTTMLSFQLYYLVRKGRAKLTIAGMHVAVWSVATLLLVLPLTTGVSYGLKPAYLGQSVSQSVCCAVLCCAVLCVV
jgi:hypothetical protein